MPLIYAANPTPATALHQTMAIEDGGDGADGTAAAPTTAAGASRESSAHASPDISRVREAVSVLHHQTDAIDGVQTVTRLDPAGGLQPARDSLCARGCAPMLRRVAEAGSTMVEVNRVRRAFSQDPLSWIGKDHGFSV